eukprot:6512339-Prymnesium_polylepis.1
MLALADEAALWKGLAERLFPRVVPLATALGTGDFRALLRAQLLAERERPSHSPPLIADYIFCVEVYSRSSGEVTMSWAGRLDEDSFKCQLWQEG